MIRAVEFLIQLKGMMTGALGVMGALTYLAANAAIAFDYSPRLLNTQVLAVGLYELPYAQIRLDCSTVLFSPLTSIGVAMFFHSSMVAYVTCASRTGQCCQRTFGAVGFLMMCYDAKMIFELPGNPNLSDYFSFSVVYYAFCIQIFYAAVILTIFSRAGSQYSTGAVVALGAAMYHKLQMHAGAIADETTPRADLVMFLGKLALWQCCMMYGVYRLSKLWLRVTSQRGQGSMTCAPRRNF